MAVQIREMDDERHRHLHRSGAPKKDQKMMDLLIVECRALKAQAPACSQQALGNLDRTGIRARDFGIYLQENRDLEFLTLVGQYRSNLAETLQFLCQMLLIDGCKPQ
uniref:Uncharacterized protein n=1 Tax=Romanomermis culicivorax TaxID=13658 RepID=A0A915I7H1_ROMCU